MMRLSPVTVAVLFVSMLLVLLLLSSEQNLLFSLTQRSAQKQTQIQTQKQTQAPVKPLADGCHSVYLDLGTNIGIQIRKLYEPHLYPKAHIKEDLVGYFGRGDRKHVCSFGWEPNPGHARWLWHEEYVYRVLGYRTHIFTVSGVFDKEEMAEFISDKAYSNNEWGGQIKPKTQTQTQIQTQTQTQTQTNTPTTTGTGTETTNNNITERDKYTVHLFDFGQWYKTHILPRAIPESELVAYGPPRVVMKVDIEGPDWKVVSQLVRMGLWCSIDWVYHEHLTTSQVELLVTMSKELGKEICPTKISFADDETYHNSRFPFPAVPTSASAGAAWLDRLPLPKQWEGPLPENKHTD